MVAIEVVEGISPVLDENDTVLNALIVSKDEKAKVAKLSTIWAEEVPCAVVLVADMVSIAGDPELEMVLVGSTTKLVMADSMAVVETKLIADVDMALLAVAVGMADVVIQELLTLS